MIEEKDEKHSIQETNILARPVATGYLRTAMYDANLVTLIDLPEPKLRAAPYMGRDLRPVG